MFKTVNLYVHLLPLYIRHHFIHLFINQSVCLCLSCVYQSISSVYLVISMHYFYKSSNNAQHWLDFCTLIAIIQNTSFYQLSIYHSVCWWLSTIYQWISFIYLFVYVFIISIHRFASHLKQLFINLLLNHTHCFCLSTVYHSISSI